MISTMAEAPNYTPKQIAALRQRLGLTQAEIAEKIGVSRVTWGYWELGTRSPTDSHRILISLLASGTIS